MRVPSSRSLFAWAAFVAVAISVLGFARTYYLKGYFATPELPALVHVHGVVMTLWLALFVAQVALVAADRRDWHRRLGAAGAVLAVAIVVVGYFTAIEGARRGVTPGPPPLAFLAIPLSVVLVFAIFVAAALHYRRRPDYHKRLMVLATLTVIQPATARFAVDVLGLTSPPVFFAITVAVLLAFLAWDTASHRRLHPAFGWGMLFFVVSLPVRFLVARSEAWMEFAKWLTA